MRPKTVIAFRCCPFVFAACCLAFSPGSAALAQQPADLADVDPAWLESWQQEIDWQVEQLSSAYALNDDQRLALRAELENRLVVQKSAEEQMLAQLDELKSAAEASIGESPGVETPEAIALTEALRQQNASLPLNELQAARWVEEHVAPPAVAEGRQRFEELRQRRELIRNTRDFDSKLVSGKKTKLATEARDMNVAISPETERATPRGLLAEQAMEQRRRALESRKFQPNRPRRRSELGLPPLEEPVPADPARTGQRAADKSARPSPAAPVPRHPADRPAGADPRRAAGGSPSAAEKVVPLAPAPPLDDWDKFVITTAGRYSFDEAQITQARSVLAGLRARAVQYQRSRSADFSRLELMEDARAREQERKTLSAPLDALFEELKQRIENLATMEQRHRAEPRRAEPRRAEPRP